MSEKNWTCKYTHHGRRNGEGFPRHALKDFEGTHISMGMLRSYKSKYSWDYRNYPAITQEELSKIIIPILPIPKQQEIVDHISSIRQQAKALQEEGKAILEQAKKEVEQMILG